MTVDPLTAFTQRLVRIPSLTGEEEQAAAAIAAEMRTLGYDQVWTDANGSVIGIIRGARPGPTVLLDAHVDTVGIVNPERWTHDPFGGEIADDCIYGRGAADMKGALAAMVYGAAAVERTAIAGQMAVSASVMEEVLEGVCLQPIINAVQPDLVIIGEATELNLNRGGRGRAEIVVEAIGRPAHSSTPQLGLNAIHEMMKVIQALDRLPSASHPLVGSTLLALTDIISDPYPAYSVIPGLCLATYDRRLLPGETADGVLAAIRQAVPDVELAVRLARGQHTTYTGITLAAEKFFPAWEIAADHPLVQRSLRGLRAAGLDPAVGAYRFCTNAAYSAGQAAIPTIGFGPGAEGDAHIVDERLELAALAAACRGYQAILESVLSPQD